MEGDAISRQQIVENKRKIGVQFTVTQGGGGKARQVTEAKNKLHEERYIKIIKKGVDDIILLRLPLGTYRQHFQEWLVAGKPPGGPEQYLTREEKVLIFKKTTKDFLDLSDEEINKLVF